MRRSQAFAVALCALTLLAVGCKSEKKEAAAPKAPTAAQQTAHEGDPPAAATWAVDSSEPVVTAPTPDDWRHSPYTPVPEDSSYDPPGAGVAQSPYGVPPAPAPYAEPSAAPLTDVPPPEAPLGAPGYSLDAPAAEANALQSPLVKRSGNPLRIGSAEPEPEPAPEPNPLRTAEMGGAARTLMAPRSLSADAFSPAPAPEAEPGAAAPPEPETAAPSFAPQQKLAMRSSIAPQAMAPQAMTVEPESAPNYAENYGEPDVTTESVDSQVGARSLRMAEAAGSAEEEPEAEKKSSAAKQAQQPPQPFDVVKVFYGTDRLPIEPPSDSFSTILQRTWPAVAGLGAAVLFAFAGVVWRQWMFAGLSFFSLGVAALLGYHATSETLERARLAQKEGTRYTADRSPDGRLSVGICEVTIPKTHKTGELEAPSILRLEVREDLAKHVVLRKTEPLMESAFYTELRERVAESPNRELFVFVHGFNVSFENAARRTAQMAHDLEFRGAPVFFSWPANDKYLLTYPQDETNVSWAAPHLKQFLLDIAANSGAESINLIAHSMGNRALTTVLRELQLELKDESLLFNQVVLAAPDIDADEFRLNIAPNIQKTSRRITLYASSRDTALAASQLVHRFPRAGDSGEMLILVPGIETVDVSAIDGGPWGHSYYGSSDPILKDLAVLLGVSTAEREWLASQVRDGLSYWVFQAQTASARASIAEPAYR